MWTPVAPPADLIDFVNDGSKFLIAGHKEPDGDCIGSQLALASALRRYGKEVFLCSAGPFKRTEISHFKQFFMSEIPQDLISGARCIILDCSMKERVGSIYQVLEDLPQAVIDHHARGEVYGLVRYVDADSPSSTLMVFQLIKALGLTPDAQEAEFLFFGLATDSGFFRHIDSGAAPAVFSYASELSALGVSPKKIFGLMNGGKTLDSRLLLASVLNKAQSHFGGKLIVATETLEETERFGENRDSDALYQLLQSVDGVEAVVIIRQESAQACAVGLRSRDKVDVASIAAHFGGGGHKNAAGFLKEGRIHNLYPLILCEFEKIDWNSL
ncbi:MAG: bifunctional oligoribonuclease/PAP phosphatase NrnA [Spirochaetaceae bacterium]|jgi:phosphoesterase RecJ-like protein|nr:bifunctional oligoribonuclease/PAP phosphatase NrnA [Spirochaetaceae bacterium]